ncbi:MAG: hypothetical protein VX278_07900, partial [Myxococcota bacterium]|nr:hypothetical protein [Myxococcota bacterium]
KSQYEYALQQYKALSQCSTAQETLMEVEMYLEQIADVIKMNDYEVASDALPFVREASSMMTAIEPSCQ